jgi:hypothetical protein
MRVELLRAQVSEALLLAGQGGLRWKGLSLMQGASRRRGQVQHLAEAPEKWAACVGLEVEPARAASSRAEVELELLHLVRAHLLPSKPNREASGP